MKKIFALLLALFLLPAFSLADIPDISGLSYDELVQLNNQINLAMWNSEEWQEVTVPPGTYQIGVPTETHPNFRITIYHIAI